VPPAERVFTSPLAAPASPLDLLAERARLLPFDLWLCVAERAHWLWWSWGDAQRVVLDLVHQLTAIAESVRAVELETRPTPANLLAVLVLHRLGAVPASAGPAGEPPSAAANANRIVRLHARETARPARARFAIEEISPGTPESGGRRFYLPEPPAPPAEAARMARVALLARGESPRARRPLRVAWRDPAEESEQLLASWSLLRNAAVLFEPDPAAVPFTTLWARPTVLAATAEELSALADRWLELVGGAEPMRRLAKRLDRLSVVWLLGETALEPEGAERFSGLGALIEPLVP